MNNTVIKVKVFKSLNEKIKGLGGIKDNEYSNTMAALFYYKENKKRRFWMLNTYFSLDIFFLDKNYKVIHVERNMKFHPGHKNQEKIQKTKSILSRYVLEMRASSQYAKLIKVGEIINWKIAPSSP